MEVPVISLHWKTKSILLCLNIAKLTNKLLLRVYSTGLRPWRAWTIERLKLTSHTLDITLNIVNKPFWSQQKVSICLLEVAIDSCRAPSGHLHFQSIGHKLISTATQHVFLTIWIVAIPCFPAMCKDHTVRQCEAFRACGNRSQVLVEGQNWRACNKDRLPGNVELWFWGSLVIGRGKGSWWVKAVIINEPDWVSRRTLLYHTFH